MWVEVKKKPNLMLAEMWKDFFEGEGIPSRLMPETGLPIGQEFVAYRVLVPDDKKHLIEEILRKL
jgi:hypothetical protein